MLLWVDMLVLASHICNMHFQMEDLNGCKVAEVEDNVICCDFSRNVSFFVHLHVLPRALQKAKMG